MKKNTLIWILCLFLGITTSAQLPKLYHQSGNILNLSGIGLDYKSQKTNVEGAKLLEGKGTDNWVLMPEAKSVSISGKWAENGRDTVLTISVLRPPRPTFAFYLEGEEQGSIKKGQEGVFTIRLKPDPQFAAQCPKDTTYLINYPELNFQPSIGAQTVTFPLLGEEGKDIPSPMNFERRGRKTPREWITIGSITRQNINGDKFKEPFEKKELVIDFEE